MPPKKDPNANSNNADKNSSNSGNGNGNNNNNNNNAATTNTTANSSTNTTLPTIPSTTTVTVATTNITIPPATVTNTRSAAAAAAASSVTSTALAVAPASTHNSSSSGGETTSSSNKSPTGIGLDTAAEQRTMAFHANAKLCRLVRKCPWMYDRTHHNYAKKHILDKSWIKIARECNDSVPSCKERWRNIRAAFARSINIYKTHSGPNRVKPYYLHKELSFLVKPMMEGRDKCEEVQDSLEVVTKDEYTDIEEDDEYQDMLNTPQALEDEEEFSEETTNASRSRSDFEPNPSGINFLSDERYYKILREVINRNQHTDFESATTTANLFEQNHEFSASDVENEVNYSEETMSQVGMGRKSVNMLKRPLHIEPEVCEPKRIKLPSMATNPSEADARFLEALLPDMALMNTRQKIIFKRKIYQTLEEVFENFIDFRNVNTNREQQQQHNMSQQTMISSAPPAAAAPATPIQMNMNNLASNQVKQTVLTVNSSTARNLINNIATLNEAELQKVHNFLQANIRSNPNLNSNNNNNSHVNQMNSLNHNNLNANHEMNNFSHNMNSNNGQANLNQLQQNSSVATRITNGVQTPSTSAAARLMHSTPKITITKVTCPPPASLRNIGMTKPPSPSTATVSTTIHHTPGPNIMTSNVHSTTPAANTGGNASTVNTNITSNNTGFNNNSNAWNQLIPIAIKDEVDDVDID